MEETLERKLVTHQEWMARVQAEDLWLDDIDYKEIVCRMDDIFWWLVDRVPGMWLRLQSSKYR